MLLAGLADPWGEAGCTVGPSDVSVAFSASRSRAYAMPHPYCDVP